MSKKQEDQALDVLGAVDIFSGLDRTHLEMIRQASRQHTFQTGEAIVDEGGADKRLYVLLSGYAEVTISGASVAMLGPGRYVGEIAVFDGGDRTASVIATSPVEAISVNSVNLKALLKENPTMAIKLIEALCGRVRALGSSPTQ